MAADLPLMTGLIPARDLCESLYRYPSSSKCSVGALACVKIQSRQPRAAVLHETFAEVSNSYELSPVVCKPEPPEPNFSAIMGATKRADRGLPLRRPCRGPSQPGRPRYKLAMLLLGDNYQSFVIHQGIDLLQIFIQQGNAALGPVYPGEVPGRVFSPVDADLAADVRLRGDAPRLF